MNGIGGKGVEILGVESPRGLIVQGVNIKGENVLVGNTYVTVTNLRKTGH